MVKLVEVVQTFKDQYALREIFVNPAHVVYLREDLLMKQRLTEGKLPADLDTRQSFTRLQVRNGSTGSEFIIIGSPSLVESKLKGTGAELLHG
tara:strand:- start:324 stop:602 length:279 start_codon:yes stop_codon:yes gene_type:complete